MSRAAYPMLHRSVSQPRPSAVPMICGTNLAGERSRRLLALSAGAAGILMLLSPLAACHKEEKAASQAVRPVRTVTVELQEGGEKVSLTGEIQPRYQADL